MKASLKSFFTINRRDLFLAFVTVVGFLAVIPLITYAYFAQDLKSKEGIMNHNNTGLILQDRHGQSFFSFFEAKNRIFVPLSDIPDHSEKAIIAIEDREFYTHPGFSVRGIVRSAILNFKEGDIAYGGSTITQQLVKNSLLHPRRDFLRKYQEIVLAQEIDRRYSKEEILEMYLNSVYFGSGAFGIEEAAQTYFAKNARDLTIAESAILAAILPSPSQYSQDQELLKSRKSLVLTKMVEQSFISHEEKTAAENTPLVFEKKENGLNSTGAHFALLVRQELMDKYGEEEIIRSGLKVKTSLDLTWQEYAEKVVADQVKKLAPNRVTNGAAVALDPKTGEVRVMVGSQNWYDEQFGKMNVVTASRQPGSAFKPIVYVAGFSKGIITPATVLKDQPTTYTIVGSPPYKPKNYDGKFRGPVLVRRALANSLNVPAVEVMNKVGLANALDMAKKLGIDTLNDPQNYGLSLVLGAGEVKLLDLTQAYGVFANEGVKNEPVNILQIQDKYGKVIYQYQSKPEKVLEPEHAFLISSILSDAAIRKEQFGNALDISRVAAVKTGTTENYRDSLTIGYTPSLVIGVWVGNNDGALMDQIAGSLGAAPIWRQLMEKFLAGTPVEKFEPPSDIITRTVCRSNGLLLKEASSAGYLEYFYKGTEPTGVCNLPKVEPKKEESNSTETQPQQPVNEGKDDKKDKPEERREIEEIIEIEIKDS